MRLVRLAAELGYASAWTPSGPDAAAFDRCLRWHQTSGLPTGISAVPASGQPPEFYGNQARRVWESTAGKFTLVVGSGQWTAAAQRMRDYLPKLRQHVPSGVPVYLAALGPLMLRVAGELADGVALNWCSAEQVGWSRHRVEEAARESGRAAPPVIEYIRTAVDPDPGLAQETVAKAARRYLGVPAYRRHFERMGVPDGPIGAAGMPGQARRAFERLAVGLDLAIVRVLVVEPGNVESAQRALQECRPQAPNR